MNPTIKDIARAATVHHTTVSRALRGTGRIPATTCARIRAVAARLGYRRHPRFLALTGRRGLADAGLPRETIGLVANRSPAAGFRDFAHYRLIEKGARLRATELGYACRLFFVDRGQHDSESLLRALHCTGIRGLLFITLEENRRAVELPWPEFSVVQIDSGRSLPAFTFISVDQFHYTRVAFRRMRELGYRRIGLAVERETEFATHNLQTAAYLLEQSMIPKGERVAPCYIPACLRTEELAPFLAPWLERERVEAVISNRTQVRRFAGTAACASMCMHTPVRGLAGVMVDFGEVGRRAVSLLASRLRAGQFGIPSKATCTHVRGVWRDGASAGVARREAESR